VSASLHTAWLFSVSRRVLASAVLASASALVQPLGAQRPLAPAAKDSAAAAVLAVVDSALVVINLGDRNALSDLMLPEAQVFAARDQDGGGTYVTRTAAEQRTAGRRAPIIERGFDPQVRIAGTIAMVWLPYDLYAEGRWLHCGVDLFTMVRVGSVWRIANFTYTIEQPPACAEHPDGVPPGMVPRTRTPD
jgi:hypothetical protein